MKSLTNRRFWEAYRKLPEPVRRSASKTYRLWLHDPRLPSLHFKKVGKFWSIRIGNTNYRALADVKATQLIGFGLARTTSMSESFLIDSKSIWRPLRMESLALSEVEWAAGPPQDGFAVANLFRLAARFAWSSLSIISRL